MVDVDSSSRRRRTRDNGRTRPAYGVASSNRKHSRTKSTNQPSDVKNIITPTDVCIVNVLRAPCPAFQQPRALHNDKCFSVFDCCCWTTCTPLTCSSAPCSDSAIHHDEALRRGGALRYGCLCPTPSTCALSPVSVCVIDSDDDDRATLVSSLCSSHLPRFIFSNVISKDALSLASALQTSPVRRPITLAEIHLDDLHSRLQSAVCGTMNDNNCLKRRNNY